MPEITSRLSTALADRYRIERHLGEGGMATVYLAEDLKHKRQVAVKVLRPDLAAVLGAERFVQEITTTANLQHPHILPLFDSGEADSFLYYVMPFIDGETLRDKLNRETQLGIEEAVSITTAIADALDYAHRHNVIHRDIKPENILIHDGRPMVADFGIALAVSAAAGGRMTETGLSLGTPHYMSPEQATAEKDLTNRADIYSLGSVLYEMLTGSPPHVGSSAQQIIMKIVTDEARPITELRKSVPPHVAAATAKSLEKLAADRFETAKDFANALTNPSFTVPTTTAMAAQTTSGPWNRLTMALAGVAVLAIALAAWALKPAPQVSPTVARFELALPEDHPVYDPTVFAAPFAVSPNGKQLVYVGDSPGGFPLRLFLRELDQLDPVPIPGTDSARAPFFSPDGRWVGFQVEDRLKKVPVGGGPATTLAENAGFWSGASWGEDGHIVYTNRDIGLARVNEAGGNSENLLPDSLDIAMYWPHVLPGGSGVLFQHCPVGPCDPVASVAVLDLNTREITVLVENAVTGWYAPTGHLVYAREDGAIFAAGFDPHRLELTGAAMPLFEGVRVANRGAARLAFSRSGTMVMMPGSGTAGGTQLAIVDHQGNAELLDAPTRVYSAPRLSPSGDRVVADVREGDDRQVWVFDLLARTSTQLTFDADNHHAAWSPDGTRISFASDRTGAWELFVIPADRSGPAEPLSDTELEAPFPIRHSWTRDGTWVVLDMDVDSAGRDIMAISMDGDRSVQPVVRQPGRQVAPAVSPDGRWLAYVSNEDGDDEVYVRPFPGPGGVRKISTNGGRAPRWISDRELVFQRFGPEMFELAVLDLGDAVRVVDRRDLFDPSQYRMGNARTVHYDISRDGQQFLMLLQGEAGGPVAPVVVLNWFEEIERRQAEQGGD